MQLSNPDFWKKLKHFKPVENWGDPNKMAEPFILKLEELRGKLGHPIHINYGFASSGHSPKSQHYKIPCSAVDMFCEGVTLLCLFETARSLGFRGIGIYFDWITKGAHLDMRTSSKVYWFRDKGIYNYFTESDIKNNTGNYKKMIKKMES